MTNQTFFLRASMVAVIIILSCFALYHLVIKHVLARMKYNQRIPIVEIFGNIELIVNHECTIYERYFANTTDVSFVAMTNSQFINVYNDLSSSILHALSPGFLELANVYMTTEEIYTYTSRLVYNWLADKVQTIPETAQDMDEEDEDEDDTPEGAFYI